eukprot:GILI01007158.1.p1 GENE.GILI01007158.1~~GILI01007158.1.p1  ORF type:complete len:1056 (-),score=346.73 GILI01007158.1:456-3395(-)
MGGAPWLQWGCPSIDLVELPRLKLSLTARLDHHGVMRLYSIDHSDLFVTHESSDLVSKMLSGIPHSLIFSNVQGELSVLVPVIQPVRPAILAQPFSTFIVFNRSAFVLFNQRYFMYPVHVSCSFLLTKGINSALYLMLLRLLHRDYDECFRLADSIATDTNLSSEGRAIFETFSQSNNDWHPDAHACRLKISLVTIDSGEKLSWDLTMESARHIVKLASVSSTCRIAPEEELQLLESECIVLDEQHPKYNPKIHDLYSCTLVKNRLHALRALLGTSSGSADKSGLSLTKPAAALTASSDSSSDSSNSSSSSSSSSDSDDFVEIPCWAPPRAPSTTWTYYSDKTIFGEKYEDMAEVLTVNGDEPEHSWTSLLEGGGSEDDIKHAPPGGWLVVACFHVLWSETCVKIMPTIRSLVPLFQSVTTFVRVRADAKGLVDIAKQFNVNSFPTILLLRGGKEITRITGKERVVDRLVRALGSNITEDDKACHAHKRFRIRCEEARSKGLAPPVDMSEHEADEAAASRKHCEWTWDSEQCGENLRVEDQGARVVLREEDSETKVGRWEWKPYYGRGNWQQFSTDGCKNLERIYLRGRIYSSGWVTVQDEGRSFGLGIESLKASGWELSGFYGSWNDTYQDIHVRRMGERFHVKGEENHLPKEQIERDAKNLEYKLNRDKMMKRFLAEKRGKDYEAIRGTIGFTPGSGQHSWKLRWNHEPARLGVGDGVGVCGEGTESYGPSGNPCLGGANDGGNSIALFADGSIWHKGAVIATVPATRRDKAVAAATAAAAAADASATPAAESTGDSSSSEAKPEAENTDSSSSSSSSSQSLWTILRNAFVKTNDVSSDAAKAAEMAEAEAAKAKEEEEKKKKVEEGGKSEESEVKKQGEEEVKQKEGEVQKKQDNESTPAPHAEDAEGDEIPLELVEASSSSSSTSSSTSSSSSSTAATLTPAASSPAFSTPPPAAAAPAPAPEEESELDISVELE